MVFPNPAITGEAARDGLMGDHDHDPNKDRAALDEAELQAVEHAEFYSDEAPADSPPVVPHRSLLDRLLGRSRG